MRLVNRFHDKPAPGTDVFVTFTDRKGKTQTIAAILNPVGRVVYGSSLDPDAEDVYDVAVGFQAECQTVLGPISGEFVHMKIWRNGPEGTGNEVFQDCDLDSPIALLPDETVRLDIEVPWWDNFSIFEGRDWR